MLGQQAWVKGERRSRQPTRKAPNTETKGDETMTWAAHINRICLAARGTCFILALRLSTALLLLAVTLPLPPLALAQADSDGDGLFDGDETGVYGTNPNVADSDGDGSNDGE